MQKWHLKVGGLILLALVPSCGSESEPSDAEAGALSLTLITSGSQLDVQYTVLMDDVAVGEVGANATLVVNDVSVGVHTVTLDDVADNCSPQSPSLSVAIRGNKQTDASMGVSCFTLGAIRLTVATTGATPDQDGYTWQLGAGATSPVAIDTTILIPDVRPNAYRIRLGGLQHNCSVVDDDQFINVADGDTTSVEYEVTCRVTQWNRIIFASNRGGGGGEAGLELWSVDPDGRHPMRLTSNAEADGSAAVSFGNDFFPLERIAFISGPATGGNALWIAGADGSDPDMVTNGLSVQAPSWNIWGEEVVFVCRCGPAPTLDLMLAVPGSPYRFLGTSDPGRTTRRFSPAFLEDGSGVVFATDTSINSIRIDGTSEVMLRKVSGVTHLDLSWDTDQIAFNAPAVADPAQPTLHGTGAWILNPANQQLTQVMSTTANTAYNDVRFAPGGTRLIFSRVVVGGNSAIWSSLLNGSDARAIAGEGTVNIQPVWRR